MVPALLAMRDQIERIHSQAFQSNEHFGQAIKEAFENFINQRQNK